MPPVTSPTESNIASPFGTPLPAGVIGADAPRSHTVVPASKRNHSSSAFAAPEHQPNSSSNGSNGPSRWNLAQGGSAASATAPNIPPTTSLQAKTLSPSGTAAAAAVAGGGAASARTLPYFITSLRSKFQLALTTWKGLHFLAKLGILALLYQPMLYLLKKIAAHYAPSWLSITEGSKNANRASSTAVATQSDGNRNKKLIIDDKARGVEADQSADVVSPSFFHSVTHPLEYASLKFPLSRAMRSADLYVDDEDREEDARDRLAMDMLFWAP